MKRKTAVEVRWVNIFFLLFVPPFSCKEIWYEAHRKTYCTTKTLPTSGAAGRVTQLWVRWCVVPRIWWRKISCVNMLMLTGWNSHLEQFLSCLDVSFARQLVGKLLTWNQLDKTTEGQTPKRDRFLWPELIASRPILWILGEEGRWSDRGGNGGDGWSGLVVW